MDKQCGRKNAARAESAGLRSLLLLLQQSALKSVLAVVKRAGDSVGCHSRSQPHYNGNIFLQQAGYTHSYVKNNSAVAASERHDER